MNKLKKWKGLLWVLPSLAGVSLFYICPFVQGMWYCFTTGVTKRQFTGMKNFVSLFHNNAYQLAVKNTTLIIGASVLLLCLLGLILALILEKNFKKYKGLQFWLLLPMAVPAASLLLLWKDLFEQGGLLGSCLGVRTDFLSCNETPLVIIGMILWKNTGYNVLLVLSSLMLLPPEYEEAARLEGAGSWQVARFVKIPQLVPMLFFTVIISIYNSFKISREIYLLKGEYPHKSIYLLQHYMSNNFLGLNYEMLTTAAFTLYTVIFILIFMGARWQQHYTEQML